MTIYHLLLNSYMCNDCLDPSGSISFLFLSSFVLSYCIFVLLCLNTWQFYWIWFIDVRFKLGSMLRIEVLRHFKCSNQGFYRYRTPVLKELILELSKAESEKESKLKGILQNLIQLFVEHHTEWRQLVSVVAGNASCNIFFLLHCILLQQFYFTIG